MKQPGIRFHTVKFEKIRGIPGDKVSFLKSAGFVISSSGNAPLIFSVHADKSRGCSRDNGAEY